jgi:membrane-bound acyltransferase YfiQ involved in biofilm formation
MSGYDIFAWIVLVILIAILIFVTYLMGSLPGRIARSRGHPWSDAVGVAGWITLIFGFALWPVTLIWAYVDVPARREAEKQP